jgi:glycosyltransferase involved in cell wall biosynthesis
MHKKDISVVIPLFNEEESLPELTERILKVLQEQQLKGEVIFVDDGSKDNSWAVIEKLTAAHPEVKGIKFRRNYGKSAGLHVGFGAASGEVVITMDADLQDSPEEIPELYKMIIEDDYDLVSGWKKVRHDPPSKTIPTVLYNGVTRLMSGIKLHDFNCGLKAYKNEVVKSIEIYGEMHRYIPVIAHRSGFTKIGEKVVIHHERKYGVTKFGWRRFINGPLDLLSIMFVTRFGKQPMHFFGFIGTFMFLAGFIISGWLGAQKLYLLANHIPSPLVTQRPLFYIALTTMIIGSQLFLAGFLGEMISGNSSSRGRYLIRKKINL